MMIDYTGIKKIAESLFEENMDKYGFSFSPSGIYRAAFDHNGKLYNNWESRMTAHKPSASEHPGLYDGLCLFNRKRRGGRAGETKRKPS